MELVKQHSASGTAEMSRDGILMISLRGMITCAALARLGQAAEVRRKHARAVLLDYRRCVLLASTEQMGMLGGALPDGSIWMLPGAYVTGLAEHVALREQAMQMARLGYWRKAFFDRPNALDWLRATMARAA